MPQNAISKSDANADQRLAYLEQIVQTILGLQSANQALLARRGYADANETRRIDIQVTVNNADWSKAMAAQTLYYSENIKFKPPTAAELDSLRGIVNGLDAIIAAQTKTEAIVAATTKLVGAFNNSQVG